MVGVRIPYFAEEDADKILIEVDNIASSLNISCFLLRGTCLGLVRDKHWIRTDPDIDIGILCSEKKIIEFFQKLGENGFSLPTKYIPEQPNRWIFKYDLKLDLFYNIPETVKPFLKEFDKITYKNRTYNVPSPVDKYLKMTYRNWRIPK